MTFHHVFNSIFNKSKAANSEIVTVELLKRCCFPFVPDLTIKYPKHKYKHKYP